LKIILKSYYIINLMVNLDLTFSPGELVVMMSYMKTLGVIYQKKMKTKLLKSLLKNLMSFLMKIMVKYI